MRACSLLIALVLFAVPAIAHPVPFSYVDFQRQPGAIDVSLTIHIYDLAHDLQVTRMERLLDSAFLAERKDAIQAMLGPRFGLATDGHSVNPPQWLQNEILQERQSVRFHLRYPAPATPGVLSISAKMFPYDPQHQTFVNVYENDALTSQMILDINHSQTEYFAGTRQGVFAVIRKFIPAGHQHIPVRPDPLVFLFGLLFFCLPVP